MSPSRRRRFLQRPVQKPAGSFFAGLGEERRESPAFARVADAPSHPNPDPDPDPDSDPDPDPKPDPDPVPNPNPNHDRAK